MKNVIFIISIFLLLGCKSGNTKIAELEVSIEAKKERIDSIEANQLKIQNVQKLDYNYYYTVISKLLNAEDKRDFQNIQDYYADFVLRYWDWYDLDKNELRTLYEKSWATTRWSENTIRDVVQVNESTYDLYNTFRFYWTREQREKTMNNHVRFVFNQKGKIIEVYGMD